MSGEQRDNDGGASLDDLDIPPERIRLRFPGLIDKRTPAGFLHVDEALDQVGANRWPLEWGRQPVWDEHPFRYEQQDQRFWTYRPYRTDTMLWKVRREALGKEYPQDELKRADELYKAAVAELSLALETERVTACLVRSGHEQEKVTPLAWTGANVFIFYTGYSYRGRVNGQPAAKERNLILIGHSSFERWLTPPLSPKSLNPRFVSRVIEKLTAHAVASRIKYQREFLLRLMQETLNPFGFAMTERHFEERIWKDFQLTGVKFPKGHPAKESLQALHREEARIREIINEAYLASNKVEPNPPPKPLT